MRKSRTISCEQCGVEVQTTSGVQRFCKPCSSNRDTERKKEWTAKHKPKERRPRPHNEKRKQAREEHASQFTGEGSIAWLPGEMGRDLTWFVGVRVPFTYSLSKNATWSFRGKGRGGHVFMRQEAASARAIVRDAIKRAMSHRPPAVDAKVYIDLFVQKPDHRGDAINVVDSVCDGIKDALGVDDRWFCIRGVDWEVVKSGQPMIWIRVGQVETEPQRVCSVCGRIRPVPEFGKHLGRECLECRRGIKSVLKESA